MFASKQACHQIPTPQTYSLVSGIGNYPENVSRKRARDSHIRRQDFYCQILVRTVLGFLIHDRRQSAENGRRKQKYEVGNDALHCVCLSSSHSLLSQKNDDMHM